MMTLPDDYFDTPRPGILPTEHPLAAARGCVYGALFGALCWTLLAVGLFAAGWLMAGIRIP
jgi:hypothetical protein